MDIILELPPVSKKFVEKSVEVSRDIFNGYFIPCAPSGIPMLDCLAVSTYIISRLSSDFKVFCSLRTKDYSLNHILERVLTASELGLSGVLVTRGDPPMYGNGCKEYSTEYVMNFIRSCGVNINIGVVISLRFPIESIINRVKTLLPDFATVIRFSNDTIQRLVELASNVQGTKLYVFLLLGVGRNIEVFRQLGQPFIGVEELRDTLNTLKNMVDGVIISSPREIKEAAEAVSRSL